MQIFPKTIDFNYTQFYFYLQHPCSRTHPEILTLCYFIFLYAYYSTRNYPRNQGKSRNGEFVLRSLSHITLIHSQSTVHILWISRHKFCLNLQKQKVESVPTQALDDKYFTEVFSVKREADCNLTQKIPHLKNALIAKS